MAQVTPNSNGQGLPRLPTAPTVISRGSGLSLRAALEPHVLMELGEGSPKTSPTLKPQGLPSFRSSQGRGGTPMSQGSHGLKATGQQGDSWLPDSRPTSRQTAALAASIQSTRPDLLQSPGGPPGGAGASWVSIASQPSSPIITSARQRLRNRTVSLVSQSLPYPPSTGADETDQPDLPASPRPATVPYSPSATSSFSLLSKPAISVPSLITHLATSPSGPQPLSLPSPTRPPTSPSMFQDLLAATRKSMASAMGDWDLQPLEWSQAAFQHRLLQGPLGPEALKHRHGMPERDIVQLYRALCLHSVGFCAAVAEPVRRAQGRERLLTTALEVCAGLWAEALGVGVLYQPGGGSAAGASPGAAPTFVGFDSLAAPEREKSVDLEYGGDGAAAEAAEALAARLGQSQAQASELQTRLQEQARSSGEALQSLKDHAASVEGTALMLGRSGEQLTLRLAGSEIKAQALSSQLEAAAARRDELQALLQEAVASNKKLRANAREQQATLARQYFQVVELEKALLSTSQQLAAEHEARVVAENRASSTEAEEAFERQIRDSKLAYRLLHSDYVVKMHDLDALRARCTQQEGQIRGMEETYETATVRVSESEGKAERFRSKWESGRMYAADLESANRRLARRNAELVGSYWPLMARLRELEAGLREAREGAERLAAANRDVAAENERWRRDVEGTAALQQELQNLKRELDQDVEAATLPDSCLAALHPNAVSARAYVRASQRRIKDLSQKLVRLVNVHAGCSEKMEQQLAAAAALRSQVQQLEAKVQAAQAQAPPPAARLSHPGRAAAAPASPPRGPPSGPAAAAGGSGAGAERGLEQWLLAVSAQTAELVALCEEVMGRDPEAPIRHAQSQLLGLETGTAVVSSGGRPGVDGGEGASLPEEEVVPAVAAGRLAQATEALCEQRPLLVGLDWRWERLWDCLERMLDWGACLMERQKQAHVGAPGVRALVSELDGAKDQVAELTEQLERSRAREQELRLQLSDREEEVKANKASFEEAVASRSALEACLETCQRELQTVTKRLTLLEEEYWVAKSKQLEVELAADSLTAAKERAVAAAENADKAMKKLQREATENKLMREKLELDLIGWKEWVRNMEDLERQHRSEMQEARNAREQAQGQAQQVKELQAKVNQLQHQLQVSSINTRGAAEQVQVLLRELDAQTTHSTPAAGSQQPASSAAAAVTRANAEAAAAAARAAEAEAAASGLKGEVEAVRREAEAARGKEAARVQAVHDADARVAELRAVVASARQKAETAEGRLRHAEADKELLDGSVAELRDRLAAAQARGEELQRQVWEQSLALQGWEKERQLALARAVDGRFGSRGLGAVHGPPASTAAV